MSGLVIVFDQGVSAITNLVGTLSVARISSIDEFSYCALAFLVYSLFVGLWKSGFGDIVNYLAPKINTKEGLLEYRLTVSSGVALFTVVSIGGGVITVVAALVVKNAFLATLGAMSVLLSWQEMARHIAFSSGRAVFALLLDLLWLLLTFLLLLAVYLLFERSPLLNFGAWVAAGSISGLFGVIVLLRTVGVSFSESKFSPVDFFQRRRRMALDYCGEYLIGSGLSQLIVLVCSVFVSVVVVGAVRGSQTLLGPLAVLFSGVAVSLTLTGRRKINDGFNASSIRSHHVVAAILSMAVAGMYLALIIVLPSSVLMNLLGESEKVVREAFPILAVGGGLIGASLSAGAFLRVLGDSAAALRARLWSAPAVIILGIAGACFGSLQSVAWGIASGSGATALIYWIIVFRRTPLIDGSD